jgi:hypothetical protein
MKTKDYARFKTLGGNRQLNELHLKRLLSSVMVKNLLFANPILVNEKFEIIDGLNRHSILEGPTNKSKGKYLAQVNGKPVYIRIIIKRKI